MTVAVWANTEKKEFWDLLPDLMSWFEKQDQTVFLTERIVRKMKDRKAYTFSVIRSADDFLQSDFVLAMGGDGTILSAARAVGHRKTPILGVHLGGFGFLAEGGVRNVYSRLQSVIKGEYAIFPRMVLEAEIQGGETKRVFALNDVVIDRGESYRLMKCSVSTNGRLITSYTADGLIISTPTGSTAYNLAAGGPIIAPWLSLFTVTPICPHTLSARPIVLPTQDELVVTFPDTESDLRLAADGQVEKRLSGDDSLLIRRASHDVQMVTFEDRDYFRTLRSKMGWGQSRER
ncbi:MAG: NAD(+)/NADH kinase [Fidelibacterota bacterium]